SEIAELKLKTVDDTFAAFIARERTRLNAEMQELQARVKAVGRELEAIDAYEIVKAGRGVVMQTSVRPSVDGVPKRWNNRRPDILAILKEDHGITRNDILNKMGLKGDKRGESSVSNALTGLIKTKQIRREGYRYWVV